MVHRWFVNLEGRELDDDQLYRLAKAWFNRRPNPEPDLVFILPNVLIIGSLADEKSFRHHVQRELGKYHRWLDRGFGSKGGKRKWLRTLAPSQFRLLGEGLFRRCGIEQPFAKYIKKQCTGSPVGSDLEAPWEGESTFPEPTGYAGR